MDISRRRSKEAEKQMQGRAVGEFKRDETEATETLEEIATGIYAAVTANFRARAVPLRPRHCPKAYRNRAQRAALFMLKERMGWSCRQAASALRDEPEALRAIGVARSPDFTFFSRAERGVAELQRIFAALPAA